MTAKIIRVKQQRLRNLANRQLDSFFSFCFSCRHRNLCRNGTTTGHTDSRNNRSPKIHYVVKLFPRRLNTPKSQASFSLDIPQKRRTLPDPMGIKSSKVIFAGKYKRRYVLGSQKPSSYSVRHSSLANG